MMFLIERSEYDDDDVADKSKVDVLMMSIDVDRKIERLMMMMILIERSRV